MNNLKQNLTLLFIIPLLLTGCGAVNISKADSVSTPTPQIILPKKPLSEIDLTQIKHTTPQGRVQDQGLKDENFKKLSITDNLIANGKDSIPFLIGKLDDETEMNNSAMDLWYQVRVGDIALVILSDFFTKSDARTSTIPGFGWDEFLERGDDKATTGEELLRKYIRKHGRKNIKARWQKVWEENKENIYWDETEQCFNIRK